MARMKEEARLVCMTGAYDDAASNNTRTMTAGDIQQKFAALAEAEERHRMQMEIQGGMLSQRNMVGGNNYREQRFGIDRNLQDVSCVSNSLDFHPPYNRKPDFMSQQENNFLMPQAGAPNTSNMSSSLQRQIIETFNMPGGLSGVSCDTMPPQPPAASADTIDKDKQFDMEVETFLACLGKEIKKKHRMRRTATAGGDRGSGDVGTLLSSPSNGIVDRTSFTHNFEVTAQGIEMESLLVSPARKVQCSAKRASVSSGDADSDFAQGRGPEARIGMGKGSAVDFPSNQMMMSMSTDTDMMSWGGQGGAGNSSTSDELNPDMTAMAKMMGGGGGTGVNLPNPQMMAMAKMMMMKNSGGCGVNSTIGMMP